MRVDRFGLSLLLVHGHMANVHVMLYELFHHESHIDFGSLFAIYVELGLCGAEIDDAQGIMRLT